MMNILTETAARVAPGRVGAGSPLEWVMMTVLVLAVHPALPAGEAAGLNLAQAMNASVANSPVLRQAEIALQKAKAHLDGCKAGYYPSASAGLDYSRQAPNSSISFPGFGSFQLYPDNTYGCHVDLSQQVYDFGRTSAVVSGGRWSVKAAEFNLALVRAQVEFEALQMFYGVLLLQEEIHLQADETHALHEFRDMTKSRVTTGVATEFDVLAIDVKLAEEETARRDQVNELHKQRVELASMMGLDSDDTLQANDTLSPYVMKADEASMVSFGLDHNPRLKIADAAVQEISERLVSEKRRYLPTISADVKLGLNNGYYPDMDKLQPNATAGVTADMALFSMGTRASVREAEADLASATESSRELHARAIADIKRAVSDLNTSCEDIAATKLHVALAEKAVEQARVRYAGGLITELDLLNAQADLSQANTGYVRSVYECLISRAALKRAVGMPQTEDAGK